MSGQPVGKMTFEQAMAELDKVVRQLESGDVPLEESIALYERGAALKARCEAKLKEAEEKVEAITVGRDGSANGTSPFEGLPTEKKKADDMDDEIPF